MAKRPNKTVAPSQSQDRQPASTAASQALQLMQQGQNFEALQVCINALQQGERNVDLSNVAGVCAANLGENALAEQLWQHAVELNPTYAQAWFNLGLMHEKAGEFFEAELEYLRAVGFDPTNTDAGAMLARLLVRAGRHEEAEVHLRRILEADPNHVQANTNLGLVLFNRRLFDEAEQHYRRSLSVAPDDVIARVNLGVLLAATDHSKEAEACYVQALNIEPHNPMALTNYGLLLEKQSRLDEAEICQRQALAAFSQSEEILSNLANLLSGYRREEEAEPYLLMALDINPESAFAHTNYGVLMSNLKRYAEAEKHFRKAMELKPDYMLAQLNLGLLQLERGRFAEGWKNYEARYDPRLPDNGIPLPHISAPQWRGEDLNGKKLLVWSEQGYGDQIQCSRYFPLFKQRWDVDITLVCRSSLMTLFETLAGVDKTRTHDPDLLLAEDYDYWVMPLSIPLHWGSETIPTNIPYLSATPENIRQWQPRLGQGRFKVGLVWRGNPYHHNNKWRSMVDPMQLSSLFDVEGVSFVSLQHKGDSAVIQEFSRHPAFINAGDALQDFSDTAAIIAQLDLVIAVDTSVAHLAGAMDKPCWVMLPYYRSDWRWMHDRTDSPWYPSIRLFRQRKDEDWLPVIAAIKQELQALITASK
jgi:tetratricopeptide (TPR) repeat protein